MPKKIVIVFFVFFAALLLKTFILDEPNLKPETVVSLYLEKEQSGQREDAEKYLLADNWRQATDDRRLATFKNLKILGESYENLKKKDTKVMKAEQEFELKEEKEEQGYKKIVLVEKVIGQTYFFYFLLSGEYQKDGEVEFEVYLKKEGDWVAGYQWKIAKIDSSTLIQYAKIGEEKEIKTKVFAVPLEIVDCQFSEQKCLRVFIRSEAESENRFSYSDWKIVDINQKEYVSSSMNIFGLDKNGKIEENIPFFLPKNFALKEIIFRNEGKEIHFR